MAVFPMVKGVPSGVNIETLFQNATAIVAQNTGQWSPPSVQIPSGAKYVLADIKINRKGGQAVGTPVTWNNATKLSDIYDTYITTAANANVDMYYIGFGEIDSSAWGATGTIIGGDAYNWYCHYVFIYE